MPSPTISIRPEKLDAWIGVGLFLCVFVIAVANLAAWKWLSMSQWTFSQHELAINLTILSALGVGVIGSVVLSARVFWRNQIHLGAWLLMFVINALGLFLATQLFGWMHPSVSSAVTSQHPGLRSITQLDAVLLAATLATVLLTRGAALLKDARRMPNWMAKHDKNGDATPRLWLFALFWITPLAWWGLLLCALCYFNLNISGDVLTLITVVCLFIVVARAAVRLVLFEKNKFTNWQRSANFRPRFLGYAYASGLTLAALLTFYAYVFMATRAQVDMFNARVDTDNTMLSAEINEFKTEPVPPIENAETLYKLARTSAVRINWEWAQTNWRTAEADTELAKNITALSYFRQSAAFKAVDYGVDWLDRSAVERFLSTVAPMASELPFLSVLELRAAAAKQDWTTVRENFRAGLRYAANHGAVPSQITINLQHTEEEFAEALSAALLEPGAKPDDHTLIDLQTALEEHLKARSNEPARIIYFYALSACQFQEHEDFVWHHAASIPQLCRSHPLLKWEERQGLVAALPAFKLASRERVEAIDVERFKKNYLDHPACKVLGRFFEDRVQEHRDSLTRLRILEAALGVLRFRRYHARWPEKLEECVPQFLSTVPMDPCLNGQRIQYRHNPTRLYSAGPAGKYMPEQHGLPKENRFANLLETMVGNGGNLVLFLGD